VVRVSAWSGRPCLRDRILVGLFVVGLTTAIARPSRRATRHPGAARMDARPRTFGVFPGVREAGTVEQSSPRLAQDHSPKLGCAA